MNRSPSLLFLVFCIVLFGFIFGVTSVRAQFASDDAFLNDISHRAFLFFWEKTNPANGLVPDRARADGSNNGTISSSAATGFGLTALCIGAERGWITSQQAYERALVTLRFFEQTVPHKNGFFYHFLSMSSGARAWSSEASSIDTWIFLSGALTVRAYFPGTEAAGIATRLYERVDWPWMMNNGATLAMGWKPESGFISARWNVYSEHFAMYLMAIGSPTRPLPVAVWDAINREHGRTQFQEFSFFQYPPLFIHQFPLAWVDFRGKQDRHVNYWDNSRTATLAHKRFCESLAASFPAYGQVWGLSSSDGQAGYMDWGGPPIGVNRPADPRIDGTVVPYASAGSMPFAPEICLPNLKALHQLYGSNIYRKYGFVDAYNPQTNWIGRDVLGIDLGITLLMIENFRSGFVWNTFMKNPETASAMAAVGLEGGASEQPPQEPTSYPMVKNGLLYSDNDASSPTKYQYGGMTKAGEVFRLFSRAVAPGRTRLGFSKAPGLEKVDTLHVKDASTGTHYVVLANTGTNAVSIDFNTAALGNLQDRRITISEVSELLSGGVSVYSRINNRAIAARTMPPRSVWLVTIPTRMIDTAPYGSPALNVTASHDAGVRDGAGKNVNFGAATEIFARNDGSSADNRQAGYFRFDLPSYIDPTKIEFALLSVSARAGGSSNQPAQASVYGVTVDTWTESTLTWANAPGLRQNQASGNRIRNAVATGQGTTLKMAGQLVVNGTTNKEYFVDVTPFVRQQTDLQAGFLIVQDPRRDVTVNPSGPLGAVFTGDTLDNGQTQDGVTIISKEGAAAAGVSVPRLILIRRL